MNKNDRKAMINTAKELGVYNDAMTDEQIANAIEKKTGNEAAGETVDSVKAKLVDAGIDITKVNMKIGRPIDPNSKLQEKLAKRQEKIEAGVEIKQGRPVVEGSERQQRIQQLEEKREAGLNVGRGRPMDPNSPRQQQLQKRQEKKLAYLAAHPEVLTAIIEAKHEDVPDEKLIIPTNEGTATPTVAVLEAAE